MVIDSLSEETQKKRNDGCVLWSDELKAKDADLLPVFRDAVKKVEIISVQLLIGDCNPRNLHNFEHKTSQNWIKMPL